MRATPSPPPKAKIPPVMAFWYLATDLYPSLNLILSEAPKRKREKKIKNTSVRLLEAAHQQRGKHCPGECRDIPSKE